MQNLGKKELLAFSVSIPPSAFDNVLGDGIEVSSSGCRGIGSLSLLDQPDYETNEEEAEEAEE